MRVEIAFVRLENVEAPLVERAASELFEARSRVITRQQRVQQRLNSLVVELDNAGGAADAPLVVDHEQTERVLSPLPEFLFRGAAGLGGWLRRGLLPEGCHHRGCQHYRP